MKENFKELTLDGQKILTEASKRDANGYLISKTYVKFTDLADTEKKLAPISHEHTLKDILEFKNIPSADIRNLTLSLYKNLPIITFSNQESYKNIFLNEERTEIAMVIKLVNEDLYKTQILYLDKCHGDSIYYFGLSSSELSDGEEIDEIVSYRFDNFATGLFCTKNNYNISKLLFSSVFTTTAGEKYYLPPVYFELTNGQISKKSIDDAFCCMTPVSNNGLLQSNNNIIYINSEKATGMLTIYKPKTMGVLSTLIYE